MSTSYSNTRPAVAAGEAMTLPQSYYTDPAWFQREMEAIHFRHVALCRTRGANSECGRLLCPSGGQCQRHHHSR